MLFEVCPLQLKIVMGSSKSLSLVVLIASIFLSACGSAEFGQLPYRSADGVETATEGTFTGTVINNDPNKIFVSYNGQSEMPEIKMGVDGVLKCSLRENAADVQLSDAQFTISQGERSWVLPQHELRHFDLAILGGHSFSVSCAGSILDSNGLAEWVDSNIVQVLLSEVFATTYSSDDSQPLGPKTSLGPH